MFFSLVKILHSLVKIKDEVCLLFAEILPKWYSSGKKMVFVSVIFFEKNLYFMTIFIGSIKMYDICSGQFPVVFDRNIRVLSSAQAQFVTALLKLILTQAQSQTYHDSMGVIMGLNQTNKWEFVPKLLLSTVIM